MFQVNNKTTQESHGAWFKVQNKDSSATSIFVGLLLIINLYRLYPVFSFITWNLLCLVSFSVDRITVNVIMLFTNIKCKKCYWRLPWKLPVKEFFINKVTGRKHANYNEFLQRNFSGMTFKVSYLTSLKN